MLPVPLFRYHATCGGHHTHDAPALVFTNVELGYAGADTPVLSGVNLSIDRGRSIALLGENGAGKSTLLKSVAGLLPLRDGKISVLGHGVGQCHHQVAYLPQHRDIDWGFPMSVRRFVLTGSYIHLGWFKRPGKKERVAANAMLEKLQLASLADRRINELSGGQQQRLLVARTLLHGADLLLLDEPFNAIDTENRELIRTVLHALKAEGKTLVTATHDLEFGVGFFDARYCLGDGQLSKEAPA
ncbi:metal ABC transporter ATP-binding protein [Cerasicoccus maritimus]|uniref:metal ABC transporter ATP-binding protein n=1 Tax=Cerasicoccus maritimus TaxID=490089 RepID=UPI00285272D5|nr:ATP-binding cassette domain-containing protein [Cerasicoccus maritimus]